jgi:hypothetical protein
MPGFVVLRHAFVDPVVFIGRYKVPDLRDAEYAIDEKGKREPVTHVGEETHREGLVSWNDDDVVCGPIENVEAPNGPRHSGSVFKERYFRCTITSDIVAFLASFRENEV